MSGFRTKDSEIKLHATVSELLAYLNVDQDPEKFLEMLSPKNSIPTALQGSSTAPLAEKIALKAAELSQDAPQRFLQVYERLSSFSTKELEPLMYILNQVQNDPSVALALDAKRMSSSSMATPVKANLSKSKSFASAAGGTTFQGTPKGMSMLRKSQSSLFTPGSSRFLNGSTLKGTPLNAESKVVEKERSFGTSNPTLLFMPSEISLQESAQFAVSDKIQLSSLSIRDQESLIIEDLLYVLLGVNGEFISRSLSNDGKNEGVLQYDIDPDLDASLADLIARILPICTFYRKVSNFVDEHSAFEYGRVHHAISATMRDILQEYHILIAQLEHQAHSSADFSLQKLWFYITPSLSALENLAVLADTIDDQSIDGTSELLESKRGGVLLSLLAERMMLFSGNTATKKLYAHLLSEASRPYFDILKAWVCHGLLDDPYNEFMVQERPSISKDKVKDDFNDLYWEQRYTLQSDSVPTFLQPFAEKILLTGKYLNVLRECSYKVDVEDSINESFTNFSPASLPEAVKVVEGAKFLEMVEIGYAKSNKVLVDLLLKDNHLLDRLRSLKTFFLLDQSDYLTHFLDLASGHLVKPISQISLAKVTSLLELVVRTPSTASSSDPYKEDLTIEMSKMTLFDQLMRINSMVGIDMKKHMQNLRSGKPFDIQDSLAADAGTFVGINSGALTGIDAFTLGLNVSFPLSLVLNKKIMTKYQMIFRHLFKCKYLERCLGSAWLEETKTLGQLNLLDAYQSKIITQLSALRGKMLHFIQQLIYFMFFEVIDPRWRAMENDVRTATTIEDLLKSHDDFLDSCLKECMLTNPKLIAIFSTLISTCHSFVSLSKVVTLELNGEPVPIEDEQALKGLEFGEFNSIDDAPLFIKNIQDSFLKQLQSLIDCVQLLGIAEVAQLGSLVSQLDFNNFYSGLAPAADFILNPIIPSR